jgi:hypothetical protein
MGTPCATQNNSQGHGLAGKTGEIFHGQGFLGRTSKKRQSKKVNALLMIFIQAFPMGGHLDDSCPLMSQAIHP